MSEPFSKSETRLGEYELLYELKSGGMGKIYLGRKQAPGGFERLAAIKTILRELAERTELRSMFLDEARLLSRLHHPGLAQVFDFGEQDQTLYLVMEYVAGVRFGDLISMFVPASVTVQLVAQVSRALHAAHELRDIDGHELDIVHRDVSPDNLMLSFDGHVKVLDFGIALMRGRQSPTTEYGTIKGKPPYLSPEQVKGERIDRRTDIWSVGVVLWEMLTGKHLFDGDSLYAVARAVEEQEIPAPSSLAGELPQGLDDIVLKALSRDVSSRYHSAQELADDLEAVAQSISAPSTGDYARTALKTEREEHRLWLREILGNPGAIEESSGRPTGMLTVPAMSISEGTEGALSEPAISESDRALTQESQPVTQVAPHSDRNDLVGRNRTKRQVALLLAMSAVAVSLILWFRLWPSHSDTSQEAVAVHTLPADAASIPEEVLEVPPTTPVEIADAAPSVDARPRTKLRRNPRPKADAREQAPETAPSPEGFGTLTVAAEPYARVRIDGVDVGATPLIKKKISAGPHVVELIRPNSGDLRVRKSIEVRAGKHHSVIER